MKKVFLYITRIVSKTDSLERVMNNIIFNNTDIVLEKITGDNILDKLDEKPDLLILPGARAGTYYREQLGGRKFEKIEQSVSEGMHIFGICAGAYVLAKNFTFDVYDPQNGDLLEQKRIQSETGLVNTFAHGPDLNLYDTLPRENEDPWSVYTAVDVTFKDIYGRERQGALALSKGPSFSTYDSSTCTSIATYDRTGDTGILAFRHGKGGGVLSGPALEVGGTNLKNYVMPQHLEMLHCRSTIERLEQSRMAWAELWCRIMSHLAPNDRALQARVRQNFTLPPLMPSTLTPARKPIVKPFSM